VVRNYDIDTKCSLCNLPFLPDEEGLEKELAGVPVKLCGKCWESLIDTVEETEAHVIITCPKCDTEIGIRVDITDDP
jgi:hypothetical protein